MNVISKGLFVAMALSFSVSALAAETKADLLMNCEISGQQERVTSMISKELNIDTSVLDMGRLTQLTSSAEVVHGFVNRDLKSTQASVSKISGTRIVLSAMRAGFDQALNESRQELGKNDVIELAVAYVVNPALGVASDICDIGAYVGGSKLKKTNLDQNTLNKLSSKLQRDIDAIMVMKVKAEEVKAQVEKMTEQEKKALQARANFLITKAQVYSCKNLVNAVRK